MVCFHGLKYLALLMNACNTLFSYGFSSCKVLVTVN